MRAFWIAWTISRASPSRTQLVVELELERDGVRALALELVALERLHRELEVVGAELVVVPVDVDADRAALAQRVGDVRGSSAAIAAATCGMCLPKRGPSVR